jgi:hypothetical protein
MILDPRKLRKIFSRQGAKLAKKELFVVSPNSWRLCAFARDALLSMSGIESS